MNRNPTTIIISIFAFMEKFHNWTLDPHQNDLSKTNYALGAANLAELSCLGLIKIVMQLAFPYIFKKYYYSKTSIIRDYILR